ALARGLRPRVDESRRRASSLHDEERRLDALLERPQRPLASLRPDQAGTGHPCAPRRGGQRPDLHLFGLTATRIKAGPIETTTPPRPAPVQNGYASPDRRCRRLGRI